MARPREPVIKPGATRRLEIETGLFLSGTLCLGTAELGELVQMLMDEAAMRPVGPSKNQFVQEAFERRREYSRIKGSFGRASLPLSIRRAVFERDRRTCSYCGKPLTWSQYHCDHVEPVSRGGEDGMENLAASCEPCNRSKGAKRPQEWVKRP